ncbi:MAG: DUF2510 domain-containing protein, partial [Actinomycetota bacterium]|nr:DUF2510 domain-containing protein [Actinomycetota bacterium]
PAVEPTYPPPGGSPVGGPQAAPVQPAPVQPAAPMPPPPMVQLPPADWYPDPHGQARLRYWDGQQWTVHIAN